MGVQHLCRRQTPPSARKGGLARKRSPCSRYAADRAWSPSHSGKGLRFSLYKGCDSCSTQGSNMFADMRCSSFSPLVRTREWPFRVVMLLNTAVGSTDRHDPARARGPT